MSNKPPVRNRPPQGLPPAGHPVSQPMPQAGHAAPHGGQGYGQAAPYPGAAAPGSHPHPVGGGHPGQPAQTGSGGAANVLFWVFLFVGGPILLLVMSGIGLGVGYAVYENTVLREYEGELAIVAQSSDMEFRDLMAPADELMDLENQQRAAVEVGENSLDFLTEDIQQMMRENGDFRQGFDKLRCEASIKTPDSLLTQQVLQKLGDIVKEMEESRHQAFFEAKLTEAQQEIKDTEIRLFRAESQRNELAKKTQSQSSSRNVGRAQSEVLKVQDLISEKSDLVTTTALVNLAKRLEDAGVSLDRQLKRDIDTEMAIDIGESEDELPFSGDADVTIRQLENFRDTLVRRHGANHPNVKNIEERIARLKDVQAGVNSIKEGQSDGDSKSQAMDPERQQKLVSLRDSLHLVAERWVSRRKHELENVRNPADLDEEYAELQQQFDDKVKEVQQLSDEREELNNKRLALTQRRSRSRPKIDIQVQVTDEPQKNRGPASELLIGAGGGFFIGLIGLVAIGVAWFRRR